MEQVTPLCEAGQAGPRGAGLPARVSLLHAEGLRAPPAPGRVAVELPAGSNGLPLPAARGESLSEETASAPLQPPGAGARLPSLDLPPGSSPVRSPGHFVDPSPGRRDRLPRHGPRSEEHT